MRSTRKRSNYWMRGELENTTSVPLILPSEREERLERLMQQSPTQDWQLLHSIWKFLRKYHREVGKTGSCRTQQHLYHCSLSKCPNNFFQWTEASSGVRKLHIWALCFSRVSRISCKKDFSLPPINWWMPSMKWTKKEKINWNHKHQPY